MICVLSFSGSSPERYSELPDCDHSPSESYSEVFDMLLFRVQARWQVSAARLYPRIFVPVEFQIRDAVNRMGETILVQVRCLRYDRGYRQ